MAETVALDQPTVADPKIQAIVHTPCVVPVCADPRRAFYAVSLATRQGNRANPDNGFWPAKR